MAEVVDDIGYQVDGDPTPKPALSEKDRVKLDSIVQAMVKNRESGKVIQAVVDDFKSKYATAAPAPQALQLSAPTFKSAPAQTGVREFTYTQEAKPLGIYQLQNKAQKAHDAITKELQGNADVKIGMVKHRTPLQKMEDQTVPVTSESPLTNVAADVSRLGLQEPVVMPQADVRTDEGDIKLADEYIRSDRNSAAEFLKEVQNKYPEKSKQIQRDAYLVDAFNSAANDEKGNDRVAKIEQNAKLIEKGDLLYDHKNQVLVKPEGFFSSLFEARSELNKISDAYDRTKKMQDNGNVAGIIMELNDKMKGDPDEPRRVPAGVLGELGNMIGGQTVKGLTAGGVAAIGTTLLGNPEASGAAFQLASGAMNAVDMYKIGKQNSLEQNYARLKNENPDMPDFEAYTKANDIAEKQAVTDAAAAGAMQYFGAKVGFGAAKQLSKGISSGLSQLKDELGKKAFEAAGVGAIGSAGHIIKNIIADQNGLNTPTTEGALDTFKSGVLVTGAMALLGMAANQLKAATRNRLSYGLAQMPDEAVDNGLNKLQQSGQLTSEQIDNVRNIINEQKIFESSIPENLPESDRFKIGAKIRQRSALKQQLEQADEAFHPELKERIKKLNEDILNISKGADRGELQTLVHKAIENNEVKWYAMEPLRHAGEGELKNYMKGIAEQANDPLTEKMTRDTFGDAIVDKAKELFPQETNESLTNKEQADAIQEQSPGGVLQYPQEGTGEAGSERVGMEPGEQGQVPTGSLPAEEGEITGAKKEVRDGGIPPQMFDLPFTPEEGDVNRLAHADTEQLYREMGMRERIPRARKTDIQLEQEADNMIRGGYDFDAKANRVIDGTEKSFTDVEQVAMAKMVGALKTKLNNTPIDSPEFEAMQSQIEKLSRASDIAGSEEGAAFRARRMFVLNDETLSDFMSRAKQANKDAPLTEEQKQTVKRQWDEFDASKKDYQKNLKRQERTAAKKKAENKIREIASSAKKDKKISKDFSKERKDILAAMRADLLKVAKGGGGALSSVPGAAQLQAIAPHVIKLLRVLAEEGVVKLEDFVKRIHADIKDYIDGISEDDVHNIIAGEYNAKKSSKNELSERLYNVKRQAELINKLERMRAGVQPKSEKALRKRSQEVEALKKQIKEYEKETREAASTEKRIKSLEEELGRVKERREKEPTDINKRELSDRESELKEQIAQERKAWADEEKKAPEEIALTNLKSRYKKLAEEYERRIREGDFEEEVDASPIVLDEEAQAAKDRYIAAKKDWETAIARNEFENRTTGQKVADLALGVLDLRRAIGTAFDFSVAFRQALPVTINPLRIAETGRAFVKMFSHWYSGKNLDRWWFDLEQSSDYKDMIDDGVPVHSPDELRISKREEEFRTRLAEQIPVVGKGVKMSNRAASGYLNSLRVDMYRKIRGMMEARGITRQNNPEAYKELGKYIGNMTGSGNLLSWLEGKPSKALGNVFFGARLMAAKFNLLNPYYYYKIPKEFRKAALVDLAARVGMYTTIGALFNASGLSVSLDPDSSDFLKVKHGNTTYDITGGEAIYVRTALRILGAAWGRISGDEKSSLKAAEKAGTSVTAFFRNKLAPTPSYGLDAFMGKTSWGAKFDPYDIVRIYPMWIDDIVEDWKQNKAASILLTGIPSIMGIGVMTK